jgi:hypothetical protein
MSRIVMPDTPFAALAWELQLYARREVATNQEVEVFLASLPAGLTPAHTRLIADLRASAALIGQASMLLSILSPHEAAVRALVAAPTPDAHAATGGDHACVSGT